MKRLYNAVCSLIEAKAAATREPEQYDSEATTDSERSDDRLPHELHAAEELWQALDRILNPPKRQPITKVRRISRRPNPITGRTFSTWYWQCALCDHNMRARDTGSTHYGELCRTWEQAQRRANHHAHNHHAR